MVPRHPLKRRRRLSDETVPLIEQARRDLQFGAMRARIWLDRVHRIRVAPAMVCRICRDLAIPHQMHGPASITALDPLQ